MFSINVKELILSGDVCIDATALGDWPVPGSAGGRRVAPLGWEGVDF